MTRVSHHLPGRLLRARLVAADDLVPGPELQQRGGQHQQAQHGAGLIHGYINNIILYMYWPSLTLSWPTYSYIQEKLLNVDNTTK